MRQNAEGRITDAVAAWAAADAKDSSYWPVYYLVREEVDARRITIARAAKLLVELGFALDEGVVRGRMRDTTLFAQGLLRTWAHGFCNGE